MTVSKSFSAASLARHSPKNADPALRGRRYSLRNARATALPFGRISMFPRTRYCVTFQPSTTTTGAAPPSDSTEHRAATSRFSPGKSVK